MRFTYISDVEHAENSWLKINLTKQVNTFLAEQRSSISDKSFVDVKEMYLHKTKDVPLFMTWCEENNIPFTINRKHRELTDELRYKLLGETTKMTNNSNVPLKDECFIPFGEFSLIDKIISSKDFIPTLITGETGNGKTHMVEQACAKNKRAFYRLNITAETDEMDLLGHYNLENGNTVWQDSPLVMAAKTGSVVLLDEIFAGNPARMLSLQGILEGKPFIIKKTGERIFPQNGFNIIATDNTKGNGSDNGRYLATNIQNTAFLDRFVLCIEHKYPSRATEKKMLKKHCEVNKYKLDLEFIDNLTQWAEITRQTYESGAIDDLISTRRLLHILKLNQMLNDREKAIKLSISRFDVEVYEAFIALYSKIDETIQSDATKQVPLADTFSFDYLVEMTLKEEPLETIETVKQMMEEKYNEPKQQVYHKVYDKSVIDNLINLIKHQVDVI